jgi:DNA-binding transcriptional ArsR family regulator
MCADKTDTYIQLVADQRRRRILQTLREAESASVDELADQLAADGGDSAEQISVDLHHNHLPKLADANVVEYDSRSNAVRYSPPKRFEAVAESVLEEPIQSDREL